MRCFMKYKKFVSIITAAMLLATGCSGLPKERESQTYTDTLFDTVISVQILDSVDEDVLKGCETLCRKYDAMFSRTNEDSDISRINRAGGAPVEVSDETVKLIKKGI